MRIATVRIASLIPCLRTTPPPLVLVVFHLIGKLLLHQGLLFFISVWALFLFVVVLLVLLRVLCRLEQHFEIWRLLRRGGIDLLVFRRVSRFHLRLDLLLAGSQKDRLVLFLHGIILDHGVLLLWNF